MSSSSTPSRSRAGSNSGSLQRGRTRDKLKITMRRLFGRSASPAVHPATVVAPTAPTAPQHTASTLGVPGTIAANPGPVIPAGGPVPALGLSSAIIPASGTTPSTVPMSLVISAGNTVTSTSITGYQPTGTLPTINIVPAHSTHATGPSSNSPRSSWEAALAKLSLEEQQGLSVTGTDKLLVLEQVLEATRGAKDICFQKQWGVRGVVDKLLGWVEKFISIGDVVASFNPVHGALPWAGVRVLLQIAISDKQKMEELLGALEDIANLIGRCAIYETLYLGNQTTAVRCEEVIVDLYVAILLYLFRGKQYYSKNTAARVIAGAFDTTLKPLLDDINNKKAIVFEVTGLAEVEYQRLTDGILGDRMSHVAGALDTHIRDSKKFQTLVQQFTTSISRVELDLRVVRDGLEDAERTKILQWISGVEYAKHHRNAMEDRVQGTGEWLFQKDQFITWERSNRSAILWLHGIPGAGKTKLTSTVIDRVIQQQQKSTKNSHALAYFYCRRDETGSSDPELVMSAIVKQLSCLKSGLAIQAPVLSMYNTKKETGFASNSFDFKESLDMIISLTSMYTQTSIIVDALDECDPLKRRKFLYSLEEIMKSSSGLVKIFVSSREDNDIVRRLEGVPNLWIEAKDNRNDIQTFVEREVARCIEQGDLLNGVVDNEMRTRITETLIDKAQGMFLWAALQIQELCAMDVARDVELRLGALPEDLENTYAVIYRRIQSQRQSSPQLAERALMWVMCSCRPFSPDELITALSFGYTESGLDAGRLFKICHNLLTLDRQLNIVRFAHLSVREFLEKSHFSMAQAHIMASESCISYMMEPETFAKIRACGSSVPHQMYTVVGYPAIYWPTHIQECQDQPETETPKLRGLLADFLRKSYPDWYRLSGFITRNNNGDREGPWKRLDDLNFDSLSPLQAATVFGFRDIVKELWDSEVWDMEARNNASNTVLVIASLAGLLWIVRTLCEKGADVNAQGGDYGSALQAAAGQTENEKAVKQLLEKGADVNAEGGHYGSALQAAAAQIGNQKTVKLLLEKGADVNAQGGHCGSALQAAARFGDEKAVELLLEKGADVNAEGGDYGSALQAAAGQTGNEKSVKLLLEKGADSNAMGGDYGCALQAAAGQPGNEKTVKLLLEKGADVNALGGHYGSTLQAAAGQSGNEKTVKLLLEKGADVNAQGGYFGSALKAAVARSGNEETVELLLEKGADVNAQGGNYGSALQAAAAQAGSLKMVELLLEKGADVNAQGGHYGNALQAAARHHSNEKTVKLLLEKGADVNAEGTFYGSALQAAAAQSRSLKTVELLLEKGADVNFQGGHCGSALQAAARFGDEKTVKLLLEKGADVNAQGGHYGSTLQSAAQRGDEKMVKLLLEKGADVNAQGGEYGSALQAAAAQAGSVKTVQLLLEKGADVNSQGGHYGNALQAAAGQPGNEKTVKLLLEKGANVNSQGKNSRGPLQEAAAQAGNLKTVELLLEKGADVNFQVGDYGSALQAAARFGNEKTVELLLEKGADVNAHGGEYGSALQAAARSGNEKTVQLLLEKGAVVNAQGGDHGSALELANFSRSLRVVELLLENGATTPSLPGRTSCKWFS